MGIFRGLCFLKNFYLRLFCWSKSGLDYGNGGGGEGRGGGKGFFNCQISGQARLG